MGRTITLSKQRCFRSHVRAGFSDLLRVNPCPVVSCQPMHAESVQVFVTTNGSRILSVTRTVVPFVNYFYSKWLAQVVASSAFAVSFTCWTVLLLRVHFRHFQSLSHALSARPCQTTSRNTMSALPRLKVRMCKPVRRRKRTRQFACAHIRTAQAQGQLSCRRGHVELSTIMAIRCIARLCAVSALAVPECQTGSLQRSDQVAGHAAAAVHAAVNWSPQQVANFQL